MITYLLRGRMQTHLCNFCEANFTISVSLQCSTIPYKHCTMLPFWQRPTLNALLPFLRLHLEQQHLFNKPKYILASGESRFMAMSLGINVMYAGSPDGFFNLHLTPVHAALSKTFRMAATHCCLMKCVSSTDFPSYWAPMSLSVGMYPIQYLVSADSLLVFPTPIQMGVAHNPNACAPSQDNFVNIGYVPDGHVRYACAKASPNSTPSP